MLSQKKGYTRWSLDIVAEEALGREEIFYRVYYGVYSIQRQLTPGSLIVIG